MIATLMTQGGPRRARAAKIAGWSIDTVFALDDSDSDSDSDELLAEWAEQRSRIIRSAAALVSREAPSSVLASEAEFVAASSHAISLAAAALGLMLAFVTERDNSVCQTCREAEAEGPYDETDVPRPPLHPHCRCSIHPIIR